MKILLFGSIASGKTTIANLIQKKHPDFGLISIDDCRRMFGDGSMEKEILSQKKFIEQINKSKSAIIEASGVGKLGDSIFNEISKINEKVLIIVSSLPKDIIKQRLTDRVWDIPFPGNQEKLDDIVLTINHEIQSRRIQMKWLERPQTTILQIENKDLKSQSFILAAINNYLKSYENDTI
jgi:adenylate kinase family enzyme